MNKIKQLRGAFLFSATLFALASIYFINSGKLSASGNTTSFSSLSVGDEVSTTHKLKVRQNPALASAPSGFQKKGARGKIMDGPVAADGYSWWQVDYDNAPDGWSAGDYLKNIDSSSSIVYSRSPSGSSVTSPVTFNVSVSDVAEMGLSPNQYYWGVGIDGILESFGSNCVPTSQLSSSFTLSLPQDDYTYVQFISGDTQEHCQDAGLLLFGVGLEGDGASVIFKVVGK